MEPVAGFEPATISLEGSHSIPLSYTGNLVRPEDWEPPSRGLKGRFSSHLSYGRKSVNCCKFLLLNAMPISSSA